MGERFWESHGPRIAAAMHASLFQRERPPRCVPAGLGDLGGALGAALLVEGSTQRLPATASAGIAHGERAALRAPARARRLRDARARARGRRTADRPPSRLRRLGRHLAPRARAPRPRGPRRAGRRPARASARPTPSRGADAAAVRPLRRGRRRARRRSAGARSCSPATRSAAASRCALAAARRPAARGRRAGRAGGPRHAALVRAHPARRVVRALLVLARAAARARSCERTSGRSTAGSRSPTRRARRRSRRRCSRATTVDRRGQAPARPRRAAAARADARALRARAHRAAGAARLGRPRPDRLPPRRAPRAGRRARARATSCSRACGHCPQLEEPERFVELLSFPRQRRGRGVAHAASTGRLDTPDPAPTVPAPESRPDPTPRARPAPPPRTCSTCMFRGGVADLRRTPRDHQRGAASAPSTATCRRTSDAAARPAGPARPAARRAGLLLRPAPRLLARRAPDRGRPPTYLVDYGDIAFCDQRPRPRVLGRRRPAERDRARSARTPAAARAARRLVPRRHHVAARAGRRRHAAGRSVALVASPFDFRQVRLITPTAAVANITGGLLGTLALPAARRRARAARQARLPARRLSTST